MPLRSHVPESVSKFEYQFGYWPKPGEFSINTKLRIPSGGGNRIYSSPDSSSAVIRFYPFIEPNHTMDTRNSFTLNSSVSSSDEMANIRVSLVVGLKQCIFSNDLTACNRLYDIRSSEFGASTVIVNTFSNEFRIFLGNPEKSVQSFGIAIISRKMESDSYFKDSFPDFNSFDVFLSYIYSLAF